MIFWDSLDSDDAIAGYEFEIEFEINIINLNFTDVSPCKGTYMSKKWYL